MPTVNSTSSCLQQTT